MELNDLFGSGKKMELDDLVGTWKKYDKGATSYAITTYIFSSNGTYKQHDETSGMAGSHYFERQGTFKIIGPLLIEMVSGEHVRRVSKWSLGSKVA